MAEDVNASIGIDIDASQAIAAIRQLSAEISAFHQLHSKRGAAVAKDLAAQTQNLTQLINRTGAYRANMTSVASATESFTTALEKNKLTMGETMRYAMGSVKPFSKMFKSEWEMVSKVARERVKDLQTQYVRLGRDANGAVQAIKIRPLTLDMDNLQTKTMLAAQRMQVLNKLVEHGSTQLLNWGKNTQWAGRQLMVGFTIPITMLGAASAKTFMDMEKQIIKIQRVYGDFSTTVEETKKMTDSLKDLSLEFTKWGVSVDKTLGLAADAAATGAMGADLINQVTNATRLAVLGNVEQSQALETTISVTNAFGIATEDLAKKIDFLNAVENQSVTSIEDLTTAIPIAAPVIKQLGGNVEDLAFFMTAMKEGGIDAGEGANALKSGLASIINPTEKAVEMLNQYGISINDIVANNKGDVKGTVIEFAQALDKLDPLNRAQAIEQLFGKFQFSRISTLFQNVIKEGTQAQRVLELSQASTEQLAVLSQRELAKVEESTTYKFEAAMQRFQASLAPVGEEFLKAVTPLLDFGTQLLNQFNNWDQGAKTFAVALTGIVAGIGPVLLMTIGLIANGVANLIKLFRFIGSAIFGAGKSTGVLGTQTEYMTQSMIEASAAASSLGQTHSNLTQIYTSEATALGKLATALGQAAAAQRKMQPTAPVIGRTSTTKKYSKGTMSVPGYASGIISVPGPKGKGDVVPAMLSPGEAIIPADMANKYAPLIQGMISGNIPGYVKGTTGIINGQHATHMQSGIDLTNKDNPLVAEVLRRYPQLAKSSPELLKTIQASGSAVGMFGGKLNQKLRAGNAGVDEFRTAFDSVEQALLPALSQAGLDPNDPKIRKASQDLQNKIRDEAIKLAGSGGIVSDQILSQATEKIIKSESKKNGAAGEVARGFKSRAETLGDVRFKNLNQAKLQKLMASGDIVEQGGRYYAANKGKKIEGLKYLASQKGTKVQQQSLQISGGYAKARSSSGASFVNVVDETGAMLAMNGQSQEQQSPAKTRAAISEKPKATRVAPIPQAQVYAAMTRGEKTAYTKAVNAEDKKLAAQLLAAKRKEIRAAEEQAIIAQKQADADKRSAAARKGVETRRQRAAEKAAIAEETQVSQTGVAGKTSRFRGVGSLALAGSMLATPAMDAASGQMPDPLTTIFGVAAAADAIKAIKQQRQERLLAAGTQGKAGIGAKAMQGLSSIMTNITGLFGKVATSLVKFIPVIGWAVTAVTILYTAYQAHRDAVEKAKQEGYAFADTISMTNKELASMAEAAGNVTATEEARAKETSRIAGLGGAEISGFGKTYLETDAGKVMAEQVKKSLQTGISKSEIGKGIGLQLAEAMAQGAINASQATSIAAELAQQVNDLTLIPTIQTQINKIIGPNGEDLAKDPLQVTIAITKESQSQFKKLSNTLTEASFTGIKKSVNPATGKEVTNGTVMASRFATPEQTKQIVSEMMGYQNEAIMAGQAMLGIQNVEQGQRMLDILNKQYDVQVEEVKKALENAQTTEERVALEQQLNDIQNNRQKSLDSQIKANKDVRKQIEETILASNFSEGTRDEALRGMVKTLYEGDEAMQALAKGAMEMAQGMNDVQTMDIQIQLASGLLDPSSATQLLTMIKENQDVSTNYSLVIDQQGDAAAAELMRSLLGGGATTETVDVVLNMVATGTDIKEITSLTQQLTNLEAVTGDAELLNTQNLEDAQKYLEEINKIQGSLTRDKLINIGLSGESADALLQIQGFNQLPDTDQKNYAAQFQMIVDMAGKGGQLFDEYMAWGGPARGTMSDYAAEIIGTGISSTGTGGPGQVSATTTEEVASSGGGGAPGKTAEEQQLEDLNFQLGKQNKALDIISMQEDVINEKYDKRKEALKEIQELNAQIADEQRGQLELADALASGDIAAAARAAQAMRAKAAEKALSDQEKSLEDARKAELAAITFNGLTRDQLENTIKDLERQIAEIEYNMPKKEDTGGGGGGGTTTQTVDVPMPDWTPDGMKPGGTWVKEGGMWIYREPVTAAALPAPRTGSYTDPRGGIGGTPTGGITGNVTATTPSQMSVFGQMPMSNFPAPKAEEIAKPYITASDSIEARYKQTKNNLTTNFFDIATAGKTSSEQTNKEWSIGLDGIKTSSDQTKTSAIEDFQNIVSNSETSSASIIGSFIDMRDSVYGAVGDTIRGFINNIFNAMRDINVLGAKPFAFLPRLASGGFVSGAGTSTSDSIPAMLSNGEYVIKAASVAKVGIPALDAINSGKIPELRGANVSANNISINSGRTSINRNTATQDSGSVYNYSVVVNAETNANPDQIASAVMAKINQVEGQRVRGVIR